MSRSHAAYRMMAKIDLRLWALARAGHVEQAVEIGRHTMDPDDLRMMLEWGRYYLGDHTVMKGQRIRDEWARRFGRSWPYMDQEAVIRALMDGDDGPIKGVMAALEAA